MGLFSWLVEQGESMREYEKANSINGWSVDSLAGEVQYQLEHGEPSYKQPLRDYIANSKYIKEYLFGDL